MPPVRQGRPAIRRPVPGPAFPSPESALAPAPISNNDFFQKFMRIYIEKVRDYTPAAPAALAAEAKDNTNRLLKLRNLDLYHGHLYIECYYFC